MKDIFVNERYRLDYKIGQGGFGLVYAGTDTKTGEQVAIKMMHQYDDGELLEEESQTYLKLSGGAGIPKVLWHGWQDEYNVMVHNLLGPSLEDLFNYCGRRFSIKTVLLLADQAICRLQHIHSKGFVHRDIKPDNFLMGVGRQGSTLFAIDYGLAIEHPAEEYRDPERNVVGTRRYASLAAHNGEDQTWSSDMEALGFVLIYFALGKLPWQGGPSTDDEEKTRYVTHLKTTMTIPDLCAGLPPSFAAYMTAVRALKFRQKPNYARLRALFRNDFVRANYDYDYVFDWTARRFAEIHGFHSRPQLPSPSPPFSSQTQRAPRQRRRRKAAARMSSSPLSLEVGRGRVTPLEDGTPSWMLGDDVRHEAVQEALQDAVHEGLVRPDVADNAETTKAPSPSRAIARRGTKALNKGPVRRLPPRSAAAS